MSPFHPIQQVKAKIVYVFKLFTIYCVTVVRLDDTAQAFEGDVVLNLFDRHFATQFREDEGICPWIPAIEDDFHEFLDDGRAL